MFFQKGKTKTSQGSRFGFRADDASFLPGVIALVSVLAFFIAMLISTASFVILARFCNSTDHCGHPDSPAAAAPSAAPAIKKN